MKSFESAEREAYFDAFDQQPTIVFEEQLDRLQEQLTKSWKLGKQASEIIADAKHMPVGGGKQYDIGWGTMLIIRKKTEYRVEITTKQGEALIDTLLNRETDHLKN